MSYRIGVMGCGGRMGQMLVREIATTPGCVVAGGTESPSSDKVGRDVGELAGLAALGIKVAADPAAVFDAADAVIDFTVPAASVAHARLAAAKGKVLVIGTTGMSAADDAAITEAAKRAPIVRAPNMSLAVNLLFALTEQVAARLGPEFDIEIFEIHHRHKIDAPSGTALALGEAAARGRGVKLNDVAVRARDGHTGARPTGAIGFAALRGGAEVGDHTVMFCGPAERIELTHKAASRQIYASGAVKAALWARDRKPGLYGMRDVLNL
ncbi:MAG TPA: 4-hydroxy-tetrahydrodipicolinate reductase [Alphaproteobacteria bacterium]|nr:4-hydroxy-tetrahydrodipicolinate reductase [Alphaproteobacteria bacterium]